MRTPTSLKWTLALAATLALSGSLYTASVFADSTQSNQPWHADLQNFEDRYQAEPNSYDVVSHLARLKSWDKQYPQAVELYRKAQTLTQVPEEKLSAALGEAEVLYWSGDNDAAIARYESLVTEFPNNPEPRYRLAQLQTLDSHSRTARKSYEQNINQFPDHLASKMGLAETDNWHGHFAKASKSLRDMEPNMQNDPDWWVARAHNLAWDGRLLEARDFLKQALAKYPNHEELIRTYFMVTQGLGRPDVDVLANGALNSPKLAEQYDKFKWSIRPSLQSTPTWHNELGNVDEKLQYSKYPTVLTLHPSYDSDVYVTYDPAFMASGGRIIEDERTTWGLGVNHQWTDKVGGELWFGLPQYSNHGESPLLGRVAFKMRPNDFWQPTLLYTRSTVDESIMSAIGLRPVTGPLASDLAGRVIRNEWWLKNTFELPWDTTGRLNLAMGLDAGNQIPDNSFWKIEYSLDHDLFKGYTKNWEHTWYTQYQGRHWHFADDRLGNGGAYISGLPFGSLLGSDGVSTSPSATLGGTGGYFSPDRFMSHSLYLGNRGSLYKERITYNVGAFAGYQDVSRFGSDFTWGVDSKATVRLCNRLMLMGGATYSNQQAFAEWTMYSGFKYTF